VCQFVGHLAPCWSAMDAGDGYPGCQSWPHMPCLHTPQPKCSNRQLSDLGVGHSVVQLLQSVLSLMLPNIVCRHILRCHHPGWGLRSEQLWQLRGLPLDCYVPLAAATNNSRNTNANSSASHATAHSSTCRACWGCDRQQLKPRLPGLCVRSKQGPGG
jgi:hypothetical protein